MIKQGRLRINDDLGKKIDEIVKKNPVRPKNVKLVVSCLPDCEKEVAKMFFQVLEDYCARFKVVVKPDKKWKMSICIVEYPEISPSEGLTASCQETGKIMIQLRDPYLSDWEDNKYVLSGFIEILAHEMIHACQALTGRDGFVIPKMKVNKKNPIDAYFFEDAEVEARVLQSFYANMFGHGVI